MGYYVEMTHGYGNARYEHRTPTWRPYFTEAAAKKAAMGYAKRDDSIFELAIGWMGMVGPDVIIFRRSRNENGNWKRWEKVCCTAS